eukprot:TRINITY_DN479_c0_g1_i2.p2 TRINITY_DN479_c0_g1~~TRINITY_DN479_c0_g1_i2.p2  ORF type:complete len:172 (-),score=35.80 TRINITY_DN479_c0_g1_i2:44-559(-)
MILDGAKLDHYEWTQTRTEVTCTILKENWPKDLWDFDARPLKSQNLDIKLTLTAISVGIKGKSQVLFAGDFPNRINTDDSTWTWDKETNTLEFTLQKDMTVHDSENPWWASFITSDEKIDVDLIEGSKYLDVSLLRKIKAQKEEKKKEEAAAKAAAEAAAAQGEEEKKAEE